MDDNTKYYLIYGSVIGKEEDGQYFLLKEGKWVVDTANEISDHLVGYDPSETPDSPYGIGNSSIMDEIQEVPYEMIAKYIVTDSNDNIIS